jgi:heterodisulfide reductase subunit C
MEVVAPIKEASDAIKEAGGGIFNLCFQCDLCTVSCPWNTVRTFLPHKVIREAQTWRTKDAGFVPPVICASVVVPVVSAQ